MDSTPPSRAAASRAADPASFAAASRRKGGRPTRRSAEEIGRRIMAAARKLFLTNGFSATSMDAVAAEAQVSKATLYARHRDKETLFQALALDVIESLMRRSDAPEVTAPGLPLRMRLEALAEQIALVRTIPEAQGLMRAMVMEGERFPNLAMLLREEGERRGVRRIRDVLAAAPETQGKTEADLMRDAEIFLHLFRPPPPLPPCGEEDHAADLEKFRADKPYKLAFFLRGFGARA